MTKKEQQDMLLFERLLDMIERMAVADKQALRAWENDNLGGNTSLGTCDWPGWGAVMGRLAH